MLTEHRLASFDGAVSQRRISDKTAVIQILDPAHESSPRDQGRRHCLFAAVPQETDYNPVADVQCLEAL